MAEAGAWLLQFGAHDRTAIGRRELLHLVDAVESFPVPLAPAHCREVLYWQDRPVPLMDLAVWLRADAGQDTRKYVGIVGYQLKRAGAPRFGALWLAAAPVRVEVSDEQTCDCLKPARIGGRSPVPVSRTNPVGRRCSTFRGFSRVRLASTDSGRPWLRPGSFATAVRPLPLPATFSRTTAWRVLHQGKADTRRCQGRSCLGRSEQCQPKSRGPVTRDR